MSFAGAILIIGLLEMTGLALLALVGPGRIQQWFTGQGKQKSRNQSAEQCMLAVRDFNERLMQLKAETSEMVPESRRTQIHQSIEEMMVVLRDSAHGIAGHYRLEVEDCRRLIRTFDAFSAQLQSIHGASEEELAQTILEPPTEQDAVPAQESTQLIDASESKESPATTAPTRDLDDDDLEKLTADEMLAAMKQADNEIDDLQNELNSLRDMPVEKNIQLGETQTQLRKIVPVSERTDLPTLKIDEDDDDLLQDQLRELELIRDSMKSEDANSEQKVESVSKQAFSEIEELQTELNLVRDMPVEKGIPSTQSGSTLNPAPPAEPKNLATLTIDENDGDDLASQLAELDMLRNPSKDAPKSVGEPKPAEAKISPAKKEPASTGDVKLDQDMDLARQLAGGLGKKRRPKPATAPESTPEAAAEASPEDLAIEEIMKSVEGMTDHAQDAQKTRG